jgi:hypothetical protein
MNPWNPLIHDTDHSGTKVLFTSFGMIGMLLRPAADLVVGSSWGKAGGSVVRHVMHAAVPGIVHERCWTVSDILAWTCFR